MLFTKSYREALKAPTGKGGKGWAHADDASMQAALAMGLGAKWCLSPQAIYEWANRHDISLWTERKRLMQPDVLLVAVLNDWTVDEAEKKLKG